MCVVDPAKGAGFNLGQIAVVVVFAGLVGTAAQWVYSTGPQKPAQAVQADISSPAAPIDSAEAKRCKVPDFAKAMGHEEKWKLHNNRK